MYNQYVMDLALIRSIEVDDDQSNIDDLKSVRSLKSLKSKYSIRSELNVQINLADGDDNQISNRDRKIDVRRSQRDIAAVSHASHKVGGGLEATENQFKYEEDGSENMQNADELS